MKRAVRGGVVLIALGAFALASAGRSAGVLAQEMGQEKLKASFAQVVQENQDAVVQVMAEVSKYEKMYHEFKAPEDRRPNIIGRVLKFVASSVWLVACVLPCTAIDQSLRLLCGGGEPVPKITSEGTGFIVDPDGYVLTNHHVVAYATRVVLGFRDGTKREGQVVGYEKETDLAMIRVRVDEPERFPAVHFVDMDDVEVGDLVVAIGNPYGFTQSVTTGVVSSLRRRGPFIDYLQTDAALNPGNSGGPLFLSTGAVIGINTAIFARGQNLGFAIPSDIALPVLEALKKGEVRRGTIGLSVRQNDEAARKRFGLKTARGLIVEYADPDGVAARVGVAPRDVILEINGKTLDKMAFLEAVALSDEGVVLDLSVQRGSEVRDVAVTVAHLQRRTAEPSAQ